MLKGLHCRRVGGWIGCSDDVARRTFKKKNLLTLNNQWCLKLSLDDHFSLAHRYS